MKAMLLAAGKGKRMLPLTAELPKPLLQVGGKSLIEWHLQNLSAAGFRHVVINHAWHGEKIEQVLGDGSQWNLDLVYSTEGEPLETAGGILKALPLLGDAGFLVVSADIFTRFPFASLFEKPLGNNLAHLVMVPNAAHHPAGDFVLDEDRLGLADGSAGQLACTYSGIGVYSPAFFAGQKQGFLPLRPLLNSAISAGRVSAELYEGEWRDIGTPERLAALDAFLDGQQQQQDQGNE